MRKNAVFPDTSHRTPGDTSWGRWKTVCFCIVGVLLSVLDFALYYKFKHLHALMIFMSMIGVAYAYVELNHLFIRKYWFENHRNLAVSMSLLIYYAVILLVIYLFTRFQLNIPWDMTYLYFPLFLMPPIIVVVLLFYILLEAVG